MGQPGQHGGAVVNKMGQAVYNKFIVQSRLIAKFVSEFVHPRFFTVLKGKQTEPSTLLNAKNWGRRDQRKLEKGGTGVVKIPRSKHWTDVTSTNTNDCVIIQNENELNRKIQPQHV